MKVVELFEDVEGSIDLNTSFNIGPVTFDNTHGLGETANGRNYKYLGFAVELSPEQFLNLVPHSDDIAGRADKIVDRIKEGKAIALPSLDVQFSDWGSDEPFKAKVRAHEGRARMTAMKSLKIKKVPVLIIPRDGLRARHFNEEVFEQLRKHGIIAQDSNRTETNLGKISWMGQEIK